MQVVTSAEGRGPGSCPFTHDRKPSRVRTPHVRRTRRHGVQSVLRTIGHDPAANFRDLRTYAWLPPVDAAPADQRVQDRYLDRRLRRAVDTELLSKSYSPVDPAQRPDFR